MNRLYKYKNGKRIVALKKILCPVCVEYFQPGVSKQKYCSKECYFEMKRIRKDRVLWTDDMRKRMSDNYKGEGNPMFGKISKFLGTKRPNLSGNKHPNYRGGWLSADGYHMIMVDGRKVGEHTFLMEKKLGRKLTSNEVVHHIDKNKLNNNLDNLQLMTRAEHMAHHKTNHSKKFINLINL